MDTNGRMKVLRNNRGVAIVYIALMLVVLLAFVGLAVDVGYMYVAKGQLQNAADSAALAGASKLDGSVSIIQTSARSEAVKFAKENVAATASVAISSTYGSNDLTANNDITVGNWNRKLDPKYKAGRTPLNAVEVRTRRTSDSSGGQVDLYFSKVFGWPTMGTSASAVAACLARATVFIVVCQDFCSNPPGTEVILETGPEGVAPSTNLFAWSSLLINPTAPGFSLNSLICNNAPNDDVCDENIYSTMGSDVVTLRNMESVMYDPNIDRKNKELDASGKVTGWKVLVPYTTKCPPGATGSWDPKAVAGYATAHIRAICATGKGTGSACRPYSAPQSVCNAYPNNVIVFDSFTCVECKNSNEIEGLKPVLVQ